MKRYAFLWSCPSCGEDVSTALPPAEEEAALVCTACGREFGGKNAGPARDGAEQGRIS